MRPARKQSVSRAPYVDPEMREVMARTAERMRGLPDYCDLPIAQARAQFRRLHEHWNRDKPAMRRTVDLRIPGPAGPIPARMYNPSEDCVGLVIYLHGGGWVFGDLDTHEAAARQLALAAQSCVLAVAYRLAPEHRFPAALEDVLAALEWLGGESAVPAAPTRFVLAGESAGANLALSAMIARRQRRQGLPRGAALFYGVYDQNWASASQRALGDGRFGLSTARMRWYASQYLGEQAQLARDPRVSPARADLHGLPPLFVSAASLDPLLDDSRTLCRRLDTAGIPHEFVVYEGVTHGFMQMSAELAIARRAYADAGRAIRAMIAAD